MKVKLIKFREDLLKPTRKHYNDAGIDCYAQEDITIESCNKVSFEIKEYKINELLSERQYYPQENQNYKTTYKVPLGFGLEIPNGYVALIKPRSSMNCKGVITYEGVIDSGYRGEISAIFSNLNDEPITFKKGDRICQIIIHPITIVDLVEDLGEERGIGGFGSTGE